MPLSSSTLDKLSDVLIEEVIDYINDDLEYYKFLDSIIHTAITHKMGQIDNDVLMELYNRIIGRIELRDIAKL